MKVNIPYFDDNSLDRWILAPKEQGKVQKVSKDPAQDLAEILKRFHIDSCKASPTSGQSPKVVFPDVFTTSQTNDWLSSPSHKKFKSSNHTSEDLSKWLVGSIKKETVTKTTTDYDKWLIKSAPSASVESSLPGIRVEFRMLPLSAFMSQNENRIDDVTATSRRHNSPARERNYNQWLAAPSQSSLPMETEEDDESNLLSQWLLVDGSRKNEVVVGSSNYPGTSVEEWLMAAASDREPSIVLISDDESDDVLSRISSDFGNSK